MLDDVRFAPVVAVLLVAASCAVANGAGLQPVLGKAKLTGPGSIGWGTVRPSVIYNGGVPSGRAWRLHWSNWGAPATTARGLTWLYRPQGGYFTKPGTVELKAYHLARCVPHGPPAYTRLSVRAAVRPGGPLGPWSAWGGWRTTCRFPS